MATLAGVSLLAACASAATPVPPSDPTGTASHAAMSAPTAPNPPSPVAAATEAPSAAPGCPAKPWTLGSIVSVPDLPSAPSDWPAEAVRRAGCFSDAEIPFVADGGWASALIPGVVFPPSLGSTLMWFSSGSTPATFNDFRALLPPSVRLTPADRHAFEMTSPGRAGPAGWGAASWRVTGHFSDAAAAGCESGGVWYLDDTPIDYTPAQAVEVCRNVFVIDSLAWLRTPPTATAAAPGPAPASPLPVVGVTIAVLAALVSPRHRESSRPWGGDGLRRG
jgi:hypothetical protein